MDQGAEAVQLPRPTLSAEARGLQLSSGGPRFTETVQVDVGIRHGIRFAGSGGRQFKLNDCYPPFNALAHYVKRPADGRLTHAGGGPAN